MKIFQLFVLIMSIMQLCAMDYNERWIISSLRRNAIRKARIASEQIKLQAEQELTRHKNNMLPVFDQPEKQVERHARWKRNKNLTNLVMNSDWCNNNVIKMLGGYASSSTEFGFLGDRVLIPLIVEEQCHVIVQAVNSGDCEGIKKSCGLLDAYALLFVSPRKPKSSEFIKNYKNKYGNTLLHVAVNNENEEIVTLLLNYGADIHSNNGYGETPFHEACDRLNVAMAQLLLDHGADVDSKNKSGSSELFPDGDTPLTFCVFCERRAMVQFLLDHGANIDIQDKRGETPLMIAIFCGLVEMVQLLLDRGASIDIQDGQGRTPDQMTYNQEMKKLIAQARINRAAQKAISENQSK